MYCSHCCFYNEEGAVTVCGQCGKDLVQKLSLEERGTINQSRKASVKAVRVAGISEVGSDDVGEDAYEYGGAGLRFIALLIDYIVVGVVSVLLMVVQAVICKVVFGNWIPPDDLMKLLVSLLYTVVLIVISLLYYTLMESSSLQGTVGKFIMKLKVTDLKHERLSYGQANIRYFAHMTCFGTLGLGYLMILFSKTKQGMHDKIAGTYVECYKVG